MYIILRAYGNYFDAFTILTDLNDFEQHEIDNFFKTLVNFALDERGNFSIYETFSKMDKEELEELLNVKNVKLSTGQSSLFSIHGDFGDERVSFNNVINNGIFDYIKEIEVSELNPHEIEIYNLIHKLNKNVFDRDSSYVFEIQLKE